MIAAPVLGVALGSLAALAGVLALRRAWRLKSGGVWAPLGWGALVLGLAGWTLTARPDMAVALALLAPTPLAYGVVAAGAKVRKAGTAKTADRRRAPPMARAEVELPDRAGAAWRGWVRVLYAGPLSGAAAVGAAAATALHAPLGEADRLVSGGMLAPVVWALGMVWATTDTRLWRAGPGLGAIAGLAFAVAAS